MHKLKYVSFIGTFIFAFIFTAKADNSSAANDWGRAKAKFLTSNCSSRTAESWLKDYDLIEDEAVLQTKKLNIEVFTKFESETSFATFMQVFFPQDLPDADAASGAYLGCISHFAEMIEAKPKSRMAPLQAWARCLKREKNPPAFQLDLSKCLLQLKAK